MSEFVGADINALSTLHQTLIDKANEVALVRNNVNSRVNSLDTWWSGPDADDFRYAWTSRHQANLQLAADSLIAAAEVVERNRQAQIQTSDSLDGAGGAVSSPGAGGSTGSSGNGGSDDGDGLVDHAVDGAAWLYGLASHFPGMVGMLNVVLENVDASVLAQIQGLLGDLPFDELVDAMDKAGNVFDALGFIETLVTDLADQIGDGLPLDEAIVHALAESGAELGVNEGIERIAQYFGGAAAAAVTGGIGAPAGAALGWFLGMGISEVASRGMEAVDGYEVIADGATEVYRAIKSGAEFIYNAAGEVVGVVGDGVEFLIDGAGNVLSATADGVSDAVDLAGDGLNAVADGASNLLDNAGGLLPWN